MKTAQRNVLSIATAALLAVASLPMTSRPAAAQIRPRPQVTDLQVRVQNLRTETVEFVPLDSEIDLDLGERYRLSLVGADRPGDRTGDMAIQSRFAEAAGRGVIDLGNVGGNWVIVEPLRRGEAEIGYQVTAAYNMPATWRTGRIRLDVEGGRGAAGRGRNLAARVENLRTGRTEYYDLDEREVIPATRGERLRVTLLSGNGRTGQPIAADFSYLNRGNRDGLTIERTGPSWVIVNVRDDDGRAVLAYDPEGSRYGSGRIRFGLGEDGYGAGAYPARTDRARWEHSQELVATLYGSILLRNASQELERDFEDDVQGVYEQGFYGLRELARDLAEEASERGVFRNQRSSSVVGEFYRKLLGRGGSNDELYRTDRGFRANVDRMGDRGGLISVVDTIVGSEEFRRYQDLDDHGMMQAAR